MPYIINNLRLDIGSYPHNYFDETHYFSAIVYIENQKSSPKSISIETESGVFTSKVISKPISVEIDGIILKEIK